MLVKKPHLRPKLGSEFPAITRAATGGTRLPGGPRLTDITLRLLFSFVVTQPNWEAEARRTAWPLRGRFWSRNAAQLSAATYSTVILCSWTAVCQLENMSGLSTDCLDLAVRCKSITLNIPSLAPQRCLSSWGPRRTPWFFCNFSTVWCGRLLKLCFLGFWNYNSVIQALLASNILCLFISMEVSQ